MRRYTLLAAILLGLVQPAAAADALTPEAVRRAVAKALPLIRKGSAGHMKKRTCFACHNQAPPILALATARAHGLLVEEDEIQKQLRFIRNFLDRNRKNYLKGRGQGGQVDTAGYALWTLAMGGWKPDATTAAVAEYLLLREKNSDHWGAVHSDRPPSEASAFTTTYVAIRGLQAFGTPEQKTRIDERLRAARAWLVKTPAADTEDRVFRLWALKRAGAADREVEAAAHDLIKTQRPDGGWAQIKARDSDAYATGTALVVLEQAAGLAVTAPVYQRGMRYLLATQLADGTWHVRSRSRPFQTYYTAALRVFPHNSSCIRKEEPLTEENPHGARIRWLHPGYPVTQETRKTAA